MAVWKDLSYIKPQGAKIASVPMLCSGSLFWKLKFKPRTQRDEQIKRHCFLMKCQEVWGNRSCSLAPACLSIGKASVWECCELAPCALCWASVEEGSRGSWSPLPLISAKKGASDRLITHSFLTPGYRGSSCVTSSAPLTGYCPWGPQLVFWL